MRAAAAVAYASRASTARRCTLPLEPANWYAVTFVNNIIANNVAGWDGAGVSLQDAFKVNFINNTIVSNDSTASAPALFPSVSPGVASPPQPAGLVSLPNSAPMQTAVAGTRWSVPSTTRAALVSRTRTSLTICCGRTVRSTSAWVRIIRYPNSMRSHSITRSAGRQRRSRAPPAPASAVRAIGEIGVRGDTAPSNHSSGFTLAPNYSLLTDATDYPGANNVGSNPSFVSQYCNGARIPPEFAVAPPFGLAPFAPVDDGKLMINLAWGPLSLTNPTVTGTDGNYGGGAVLGNYALAAGSPAIDYVPRATPPGASAPTTDFFGNPRPNTPLAVE